jgi:pilus assembly protein Flp/PilA
MYSLSKMVAGWLSIDKERGVTAIEYAFIAALIAAAIVTAVALIGTNITPVFNTIAGKI